jgi:ribosomal protein S18 acetylase RimI-like enzyme
MKRVEGSEAVERVLRQLAPEDIPFASEVRALAGWNQTEKDWHGYLRFAPQGCFIAEINGVPAGTATTIDYDRAFGWIGMVLVHPSFRRLGVGSALLEKTIAHLQQNGTKCIKLDATPMGRTVYVPMGFKDEYDVVRYEGIVPQDTPPGRDLRSLAEGDIVDVAEFDAPAFGAIRATVLAELSQRNPEFCFVAVENGQVKGYLIAREGARAVQVGPFVANDPAIAESLLNACFYQMRGRPAYIDVPVPNEAARLLVEGRGFTEQRRLTRMFLGENSRPGDPTRVFGTSGGEKG